MAKKTLEQRKNTPMYKGKRGSGHVDPDRTKKVETANFLYFVCGKNGEARIWSLPTWAGMWARGEVGFYGAGQLTIYQIYAPASMPSDEITKQIGEFWLRASIAYVTKGKGE